MKKLVLSLMMLFSIFSSSAVAGMEGKKAYKEKNYSKACELNYAKGCYVLGKRANRDSEKLKYFIKACDELKYAPACMAASKVYSYVDYLDMDGDAEIKAKKYKMKYKKLKKEFKAKFKPKNSYAVNKPTCTLRDFENAVNNVAGKYSTDNIPCYKYAEDDEERKAVQCMKQTWGSLKLGKQEMSKLLERKKEYISLSTYFILNVDKSIKDTPHNCEEILSKFNNQIIKSLKYFKYQMKDKKVLLIEK